MITATVSELREKISELLGVVQHTGNYVTILKHGKPVAALVSMEDVEFMERAEDAYWVQELARMRAEPGYDPNDTVPHEVLWAELLAEDAAE